MTDVLVLSGVGPVLGKDGATEGVDLGIPHRVTEAGTFESEFKSADAGEE